MPMTWTAKANAKLLLAIIHQIKAQSVKLNYKEMAEYIGPDCSHRAVEYQLQKLKKQASGSDDSTASATAPGAAAGGAGPATPTKPKTPRKRAAAGSTKTGTPAKKKKGAAADGNGKIGADEEDEVEKRTLGEVRDELKNSE
ncbi:uncharacterized protein BDV17DRAFT_286924 [Aspergillus undulatus]|uniref:uncharacterized protein n=1 Tax=Aspergillus undulatus TaxID=1810928 RepID=UPI003CCD32BA